MSDYKGLFFTEPLEANAIGHQMAEIYRDGIYYPYVHGRKDLTIIDAGANLGFFTYFASRYAKKVYSIEPSKEHMDVLKHMVKYNKLENIVVPCQFALSVKDGDGELSHYTNKTMYSLYENLAAPGQFVGNLAHTGKEPTKLKRLDTFLDEEKIEHVDLLKLDVEGVEYEILGGEGFKNAAPKIDIVIGEIHTYSGRNPSQIKDALEINGFQFQWIRNLHDQNEANLFVATKNA